MAGAQSVTLPGIHHVTAICGEPQRNLVFYTNLLGLRLVKKTVNFDDPGTYHLYYGDALGSPGTILTFFAWVLPPMVTARARRGTGQISATSFSIPAASLDFWIDRLAATAIDFEGPAERFGEPVISLEDPDGLPLELVARGGGALRAPWTQGPVPEEHAIRGFAGVTLCLNGCERTAELLTATMGARRLAEEGSRLRFQVGDAEEGATIDLHRRPESEPGRMGIGAVHHIAWRTPSGETQLEWRRLLAEAGLDVTPVRDRHYFQSIYYREPGGVLFEIATDLPGFTVGEAPAQLGTHLELPPWLEPRRQALEARLPELRLPAARP